MLELAFLTLAVVLSIGPTNLFAIKEGLKHGASHTFFIVFGGILVDLLYANLAGLGLSAIGENIYFKLILLFMGSIIFLYLGGKGLKTVFQKEKIQILKIKRKTHPLISGFLITLPNPLTIVFWITAIAGLSIGYSPLIFLVTILTIGAAWAGFEAGLIRFSRKYVNEKLLHGIEIATSLIFLGFAIKFFVQFLNIVI